MKPVDPAATTGPQSELAETDAEHVEMPLDTKNPLTMIGNANRIARLILKEKVDIVHARSRAPAWSALLAARRTGVPWLATYHGIYDHPVTLSGGIFEGAPFADGGVSAPRVELLQDFEFGADVNGDGLQETIVLLSESSGGSGTFSYLATLTIAEQSKAGTLAQNIGALAITIAVVSNSVVKTGIAIYAGGWKFGRVVAACLGIATVVGLGAAFLV